MTVKIQTWGCGKTKEQRKFKTRDGKPVVVIDQSVECRYSNIVPEEQDPAEEAEVLLEIDPEELEENPEENTEEQPQHLREPVLNEAQRVKTERARQNQHNPADPEMQRIKTAFKRFLE